MEWNFVNQLVRRRCGESISGCALLVGAWLSSPRGVAYCRSRSNTIFITFPVIDYLHSEKSLVIMINL